MKLAPEGRPFVIAATLVLAALAVLTALSGGRWSTAFLLWIPVAVWIPAFFRDPMRRGPRAAHLILAPADGKVVDVAAAAEEDYISGQATRIAIFMNILDAHVNRHPVEGVVEFRQYRAGKFVNATLDKASDQNERMSLGVSGRRGRILVRQIAGLIARRIVTDHGVGDSVMQGDRLGMIRFGSRVETYLPPDAKARVSVGDRTRAGVTVIGEWPR